MGTRMSLTRHGGDVTSVFDLLGRDENDLTAALAFTLANSPGLLDLVLHRLNMPTAREGTSLRLEERDEFGRTDLEIDTGTHLAIIEAKRGWLVPGEIQFTKYAPRIAKHGAGCLVSLSAASSEWASQTLPHAVQGVPVIHYPWDSMRKDLLAARARTHGGERAWLSEFNEYLRKAVKMRDPADSWTYCVVVNKQSSRWRWSPDQPRLRHRGALLLPSSRLGKRLAENAAESPGFPLGQPGATDPPRHLVGSYP